MSRADTMGVFQIESRAQMSMLPRLRPAKFYDLVIEVAIVRPGPIQGNMVHPYLRRRAGEEPVEYPTEEVCQVLYKTLGVPIFQEQAMKLAIVAAGFTPGEADQLRRAMAAWRRKGGIDAFRDKLLDGMRANGISDEFAERLYQQICGFGEYGFPESHAASFALLVYVSAWLKCRYPAAFCAALINSQPMGFYAPGQLIRDAREHGVAIRAIDVSRSEWDLTLEQSEAPAVRLGLRLLQGMPEAAARRIAEARRAGPFSSTADLARRADLGQSLLMLLARADALRLASDNRRAALWSALAERRDRNRPLFAELNAGEEPAVAASLPPALTPLEEVLADYRSAGFSLRAHPVAFLREQLRGRQSLSAADLAEHKHGELVRTAGLVLLRQRPSTAKGITFVTLEDETGVINLVLHAAVWQRYREVARAAKVWLVDGRLEKKEQIVHVVAARLVDLTSNLRDIAQRSRDFQ